MMRHGRLSSPTRTPSMNHSRETSSKHSANITSAVERRSLPSGTAAFVFLRAHTPLGEPRDALFLHNGTVYQEAALETHNTLAIRRLPLFLAFCPHPKIKPHGRMGLSHEPAFAYRDLLRSVLTDPAIPHFGNEALQAFLVSFDLSPYNGLRFRRESDPRPSNHSVLTPQHPCIHRVRRAPSCQDGPPCRKGHT